MFALLRLAGLPWLFGRAGRLSSLPTQPDFWRLWFIGLILNSVRYLEMIAMAIFVYRETNSPILVATIAMLRMAPMALFGALLGGLTDRFDRRFFLILVVSAGLATSLALTGLAYYERLEVWHLAVASVIGGVGWSSDFPGRRIMIAEVVGLDRLSVAMSLDAGASQTSRVAGPLLGGALLVTLGLTGCFALEAILCIVALVSAFAVTYRNAPHQTIAGRMLSHISDGLKAAHRNVRLRNALLATILYNVFAWPCTSMIPVIGQDQYGLDADAIGVIASMEGVGALFGSIVIGIIAQPARYPWIYLGGAIGAHAALLAFALAPTAIFAGNALLIFGVAGAGFSVMQSTMIYHLAPPDMRGRVLGLISVCIGFSPLGFLQIGAMASVFGAKGAVATSTLVGLTMMTLLYRQWRVLIASE